MNPRDIPTPKSGTGWAWLAVAGLGIWMVLLNGGNTRTEFSQGFGEGYGDTCAEFFAADPGEPPSRLSPGCDSQGNHYPDSPQRSGEVAGAEATT